MKLLMYEKCWDAFIKLPKNIQKKVRDFMKKFRQDSKSAAIHLEPISTFKDKNLRTARINKQYRAIIRVPDSGDMYHLLWVDNHDEAMDWAANKIFNWNINTQSYQVFTAPEIIQQEQIEAGAETKSDPIRFLDKFTDEQLQNIGVPPILLPSVRPINGLEELEAIESFLPDETFENLFFLFDGVDIEQIIFEVAEGKSKEAEQEKQIQSANNQRSFFELTDDTLLNEMLEGTLQKWKIFLHPSQRTLVNGHHKGSMKITGGAGTGKTVAALHRAKYLQDNDLGRNGKSILFTTYTKALTENLKQELSGMKIDSSIVKLQNLDRFVIEQAKKLALIDDKARILDFPGSKSSIEIWEEVLDFELSQFDSDFLDKEYKEVILFLNLSTDKAYFKAPRKGRKRRASRKDKMEIWRLLAVYQAKKKEQQYWNRGEVYNLLFDHYKAMTDKPFGHVIADEIQDFSNIELRLLRSLVTEKPNDLFLVGDPLQKIYKRQLNFSKAGIHIRGRRSRRLKINYRTTEKIRKAAVSIIKNISFDNFDGEAESKKGYVSLVQGKQIPSYQTFSTKKAELDFLFQKIEELAFEEASMAAKLNLSEICIAARTKNGIKDIKSFLHQQKLPYFDLSQQQGNIKSGIRLSTFHSLKGLEFKAVFLADVQERTVPSRPAAFRDWDTATQTTFDQRERALVYVAMSRAIQVLFVSGVGSRSTLIQIG